MIGGWKIKVRMLKRGEDGDAVRCRGYNECGQCNGDYDVEEEKKNSLFGCRFRSNVRWNCIVLAFVLVRHSNVAAFVPLISSGVKRSHRRCGGGSSSWSAGRRRLASVIEAGAKCESDVLEAEDNMRESESTSMSSGRLLKMADKMADKAKQEDEAQSECRSETVPWLWEEGSSAKSRRVFVSSMLSLSGAWSASEQHSAARAAGLTWAESPINKRSGITVSQAEEVGYNVRFVTYLSRFLITFDEECQRWWYTRARDIPRFASAEQVSLTRAKQFGAFSASAEVGLQEFEGSDGSLRLMRSLLERYCPSMEEVRREREQQGLPPLKPGDVERTEREIKESRRQIALLFGLLDTNQPVDEITKTLAAIDNAKVVSVRVLAAGGGYALGYGPPAVRFPPPLAGEKYDSATGRAVLRSNGRILRIDLKTRGKGYAKPPLVTVSPPLALANGSTAAVAATARAYLFRAKDSAASDGVNTGRVARIQVLSPGAGYLENEPIRVHVAPPAATGNYRAEPATAQAVLEYEVGEIQILNPGCGYASEKPIDVAVDPPPLTARINIHDPMVMADGYDPRVSTRTVADIVFANKNPEVYDPTLLNPKGNLSKLKSQDSGRVLAVAETKARYNSYTSFRNEDDSAKDKQLDTAPDTAIGTADNNNNDPTLNPNVKGTASGDQPVPLLPFWSGGTISSSSQLLALLPSGIGLQFDQDNKRYILAASQNIGSIKWLGSEFYQGKPINPDFGTRGRSPIERQKDLDISSFGRFLLSGALCCSAVHLALTPLDVMKTKVQTNPKKYKDFFTSFKIISSEGPLTDFFVGWLPTFVGFFINGGIAYSLTEFFRGYFGDIIGDAAPNLEIPIILASAGMAAFVGAFFISPTEAVRIRSVAQPDYAPNVIEVTKRMVSEEGLESLFSTIPVFLLKDIPFATAKFCVFDVSTAYLYEQFPVAREDLRLSLLVSLVGGTLGGIAAAIISNPADVTISEMKKSKSDIGPLDSIQAVYNKGGTVGFFRGLDIRLFFYTLLVSFQFLLYDAVRFSLGIGSDDMKLFLDVLGGALRESGGPV